MRLRGGTRGILSAIEAGRLDPLDGWLPEDRETGRLSGSDRRAILRRDRNRLKRLAARSPF